MMAISSVDLEIKIDGKLIRPADNQIIIGSSAKIQERIGWQPEIKLEQSLNDLLHFWENKLQS
jgi:GDP-4-dehydro-6-deoxy-D-mannose reductase